MTRTWRDEFGTLRCGTCGTCGNHDRSQHPRFVTGDTAGKPYVPCWCDKRKEAA